MSPRAHWVVSPLVLGNVLAGTMLIPAVRPFFAAVHGGSEGAMHAFFSVNMLGAALGAPLLSSLADRTGQRRRLAVLLGLVDALLLLACALPLPVGLVLGFRFLQGAATVGALSVVMGLAREESSGEGHGGTMGAIGGSVVAAIALGAPLGTLLLKAGPLAPLWASAAVSAVVAGGCLALPEGGAPAPRGRMRRLLQENPALRLPALFVGAERFAVGCFVVTFSLYAHGALGLSDARIGMLFSWFLVPFALASWPMGLLAGRVAREKLLAAGGLVYGLSFLALGQVGAGALAPVLFLAGLASAALYSPSLCLAAELAPPALRGTSMGLLNAAGSVGMMLGTATGGMLSAGLMRADFGRVEASAWVFRLAGAALLGVLAASWPSLRLSTRAVQARSHA